MTMCHTVCETSVLFHMLVANLSLAYTVFNLKTALPFIYSCRVKVVDEMKRETISWTISLPSSPQAHEFVKTTSTSQRVTDEVQGTHTDRVSLTDERERGTIAFIASGALSNITVQLASTLFSILRAAPLSRLPCKLPVHIAGEVELRGRRRAPAREGKAYCSSLIAV